MLLCIAALIRGQVIEYMSEEKLYNVGGWSAYAEKYKTRSMSSVEGATLTFLPWQNSIPLNT